MITVAQLHQIMPQGGSRLEAFVEPLNVAMDEWGITSPVRAAAFLAQIAHESGQFRYMQELASGEAYEKRADLGNTRPEAIDIAAQHNSTPGRWWKGHGPIQITGYDNHHACGEALNLDLLHAPQQLTDPLHGCRSAGWFWAVHKLNALADAGDFEKITRRINGGLTHYDERCEIWGRARAVLS